MLTYNALLVKYKNSFQLRLYEFPIESKADETKECAIGFEATENEIDNAFAKIDDIYHFDGHSSYVSINRSKNKIFYLARSNNWENGYFCTLTIDPKRYDRCDYKVCSDLIRKFLQRLRNYDSSAYALFVPEKHKNGGFHFHGLIGGINLEKEKLITFSGHTIKGEKIYNFVKYWEFGFNNITKVQNTLAVEKYITKYTTKELLNDTKYQHRYFTLHLSEAEMLKFNFKENELVLKDLIQYGFVQHLNTDGLYRRCTYIELSNDKNILTMLSDYGTIKKV